MHSSSDFVQGAATFWLHRIRWFPEMTDSIQCHGYGWDRHGTHDAVIAPVQVLLGYTHNSVFNFTVNSGTTRIATRLRPIELTGYQPPVPVPEPIRVSGFTTLATSSRALRPGRFAISARLTRSASVSRNEVLSWAFRTRFSATGCSLRKRSSWSTVPVINAGQYARPIHKTTHRRLESASQL